MNQLEFVTTITGQILSWPVAMIVIVLILRNPLRNLLRRLNEAEGFGVRASFQELTEAVDRIELEADLQPNRHDIKEGSGPGSGDSKLDLKSPEGSVDATRTMRLRSALQEASANPKRSIRSAREQLHGRVKIWASRTLEGDDVSWSSDLYFLERFDVISSDLKISIANADRLGRSLSGPFQRPTEAEALSYLSLINRIERLLDDEAVLSWKREDEKNEDDEDDEGEDE